MPESIEYVTIILFCKLNEIGTQYNRNLNNFFYWSNTHNFEFKC